MKNFEEILKEHAIWIIDFGSQYTQLITRKFREQNVSSIIITPEKAIKTLDKGIFPSGLVLSGGPNSVFEDKIDFKKFFTNEELPILGICYGMQIISTNFGGVVEKGVSGEYGNTSIHLKDLKINGIQGNFNVWMSHFDHVKVLPENFELVFESDNAMIAGMKHESRPILGLQFHPEVSHSDHGDEVLTYFIEEVSKIEKDWKGDDVLEVCQKEVSAVSGEYVLCAFSGGVDSLVAATLAEPILKEKLFCFFVDNGLLRPQDYQHIKTLQERTQLNIEVIDGKEAFYKALAGKTDPEEKRKAIGVTFIELFEQKVHEFEEQKGIKFSYLLQGTLYPDVIESISPHEKNGKSATIKSHHNVGGLPERMHLKLLEPLKWLFKDEVRKLGEKLGLPFNFTHRHPFPGPGLGVRILGEITKEKIDRSQLADQILFEELHKFNLYNSSWQAFCVYLPVKTVGVKGDARAYEEVICLRMVTSTDGMTCKINHMPYEFLEKVSSRIVNEVSGITRVVYDITSKPPGTIEWE